MLPGLGSLSIYLTDCCQLFLSFLIENDENKTVQLNGNLGFLSMQLSHNFQCICKKPCKLLSMLIMPRTVRHSDFYTMNLLPVSCWIECETHVRGPGCVAVGGRGGSSPSAAPDARRPRDLFADTVLCIIYIFSFSLSFLIIYSINPFFLLTAVVFIKLNPTQQNVHHFIN